MAQIIRALGCVVIALVATAANSEIVGVWEGTENGLPSVELSVQIKDGKGNGSIASYFQSRGAEGSGSSETSMSCRYSRRGWKVAA